MQTLNVTGNEGKDQVVGTPQFAEAHTKEAFSINKVYQSARVASCRKAVL